MIGENLSKLGDFSNPKAKGYYFDINEWIYDTGMPIDPKSYYVTSGDAISKTNVLEAHIYQHFKSHYKKCVREIEQKCMVDYEEAKKLFYFGKMIDINQDLHLKSLKIFRTIANARLLICKLIDARGRHLLMETDSIDGLIVCYPKNPRGTKFI